MTVLNTSLSQDKIRHQVGTEKSTEPLSPVRSVPSEGAIVWSRIAIPLTIVFWIAYVITTVLRQILDNQAQGFRFTMEALGYIIIVSFLTLSALAYLIAREGALQRFAKHKRVPRSQLDSFFADAYPSITVLIPSYAEEPHVVRQTLLSVALQEYAAMRIVLLIDDPPHPSNDTAKDRLNTTRQLPQEVEDLFEEPYNYVTNSYERWQSAGSPTNSSAITDLADTYRWSSRWLNAIADKESITDHVDIFLIEQVIKGVAGDFHEVAAALDQASKESDALSSDRIAQLFQRLCSVFHVEIDSFERKQYLSTSHEANKAMNLNSYIALMGKDYTIENCSEGRVLVASSNNSEPDISVPDSDFVLTLDADSILLREYCLRLIYLMMSEGNERVAVAQTPYSAFRGAGTRIERLAGATTDLQHIQHQGMTHYKATFWVGANAVIRKSALEDIAESDMERGFPITRYIQDRTVIEDTESSIDLADRGWQLINYPERLSYSATPPDFGSLVVQRQRWANGGLLILPKMFRRRPDGTRRRIPFGELALRINYMASIAWASFSLLFLLAYPYDGRLLSPLVVAIAAPYFISMAFDLHSCRYKWTDVFRIYGFNLILLPVNLAGVLTSLGQGLTGHKIPFARTPKVKNRTVTPVRFIVLPLLIILFSLITFASDFRAGNYGNAAFALFNATLATWAFVSYIGIRNAIIDIWLGAINFLFVDVPTTPLRNTTKEDHWRQVLDGDLLTLEGTRQ